MHQQILEKLPFLVLISQTHKLIRNLHWYKLDRSLILISHQMFHLCYLMQILQCLDSTTSNFQVFKMIRRKKMYWILMINHLCNLTRLCLTRWWLDLLIKLWALHLCHLLLIQVHLNSIISNSQLRTLLKTIYREIICWILMRINCLYHLIQLCLIRTYLILTILLETCVIIDQIAHLPHKIVVEVVTAKKCALFVCLELSCK